MSSRLVQTEKSGQIYISNTTVHYLSHDIYRFKPSPARYRSK